MEEMDIARHHQQAHLEKHTHPDKPTGNIQHTKAPLPRKWKTTTAPNTMATKHMAKSKGTQHKQQTLWTQQLWNKQMATPNLETSQASHTSSNWHPFAHIKI
jgi:hypothetical protein